MAATPSPSPLSTEASRLLDTTTPNVARIFDFLLDGSANFAADREAADRLLELIPPLQKWIRLRRAFIQEAAQLLHAAGFRQFLDLGTGMPTEDHIHVAAPQAQVVYSDINPVAISFGQSLFAQTGRVTYIYGDGRDVDRILMDTAVQQHIDRRRPVAIGLNALPLFLLPAEIRQLAQTLHAWAPDGSQIFAVFQTCNDQPSIRHKKLLSLSAAAGLPMRLYSLAQNIDMLQPWRINRLESLTNFLGLSPNFISKAERNLMDVSFFAALMGKETTPYSPLRQQHHV